ncbi:hypothetical protein HYV81_01975 [Candidatus Woesearchaeota archaeon]|nr:hypothetical protein [Candidatus Woesearchaeota archaeon]
MTFTTIFKQELLNLLDDKTKRLCKSEEIEYSKGTYKIKFDVYIEKDNSIFIIEIELRRSDPINNLIKTLHWKCSSIDNKKINMIQIFDKNYYTKPENKYKKDFTLFLAKRCNLLHKKLSHFSYRSLDITIDEKAYKRKDMIEAKRIARNTYKQLIGMIEK